MPTTLLSPLEGSIAKFTAEPAQQLTLSPRTVERHLSNAYLKLNISGKAARTAAAASVVRDDLQ